MLEVYSVYYRIFGNLDYYLSFNINRKIIDDKRLIEYMKPSIIRYYEETFRTHASSADKSDPKSYQEFKKKILSQTQVVKRNTVIVIIRHHLQSSLFCP